MKSFRFVNLTPHEITIVDANGNRLDIVSNGLARVKMLEGYDDPLGDIPVIRSPRIGALVGLPAPEDGNVFLVSNEVLAHPDTFGRRDVYAPATRRRHSPYRDDRGNVIGVCALISAPRED